MRRFFRGMFVLPIRGYQLTIGRIKGDTCRFQPTCSEYTAQAILLHGVLRGIWLGTWRILRCQPFGGGGFDPVPPRKERARKSCRG